MLSEPRNIPYATRCRRPLTITLVRFSRCQLFVHNVCQPHTPGSTAVLLKYSVLKNLAEVDARLGRRDNALDRTLEALEVDATDSAMWYASPPRFTPH